MGKKDREKGPSIEPDLSTIDAPQVGDWVRVWGQVKKTPEMEGVHPEDMLIEFTSHNANYCGDIRLEHIEFTPGETPPGTPQCSHMWADGESAYVRCGKPFRHPGEHRADTKYTVHTWTSADTSGYFEER